MNNRYSYLNGLWIGEYNCNNKFKNKELINIKSINNGLLAIKKTGDACIKAGDTTWIGNIDNNNIYIKIKGYNHIEKRTAFVKAKLLEINKNEFDIRTNYGTIIHFFRVK